MKLQTKLDKLQEKSKKNIPPETAELMSKATIELVKSGIMDSVLKPGDTAPKFALEDQKGNSITLQQSIARGPLVVSFYRGVW